MSDEEGKADLLEKLKELDRREGEDEPPPGSFRGKFKHYWTKFKIKEALGHLGLLAFLGIYCGVGGIVSADGAKRVCGLRECGLGSGTPPVLEESCPSVPETRTRDTIPSAADTFTAV